MFLRLKYGQEILENNNSKCFSLALFPSGLWELHCSHQQGYPDILALKQEQSSRATQNNREASRGHERYSRSCFLLTKISGKIKTEKQQNTNSIFFDGHWRNNHEVRSRYLKGWCNQEEWRLSDGFSHLKIHKPMKVSLSNKVARHEWTFTTEGKISQVSLQFEQ